MNQGRVCVAVAEQIRNDVWGDLLNAARLVRYYESLADRHRRWHQRIRFVLFLAAASGVAALLDVLPEPLELVAGASIAVIVALDFMLDYGKKSAVLHAISIECSILENEWAELWTSVNIDGIDDAKAISEGRRLSRRLLEVTARAGLVDVRDDPKLNERSMRDANEVIENRYA